MKRKIFLFFALVLAMFGFAGCNLDDDDTTPEAASTYFKYSE